MLIDDVILEMFGSDPRIMQIAVLFNAEPYGQTRHIQDAGQDRYYAAIRIETGRGDQEEMVDEVLHWLSQNASLLNEFRGEKFLEIQSHMRADDGSRTLCLDHEMLAALARAGVHFRHQVSREIVR